MNIFVTGPPGVGKTTIVQRAVELLRRRGFKAGGLYSPEIRTGGERLGFEIVDLATGERGTLAHTHLSQGPIVGRYRVNLEDLSRVAVRAIDNATRSSDFIVIDEVGPMELKSEHFQTAVLSVLDGSKPVLGIIHQRAEHQVIDAIRRRRDTQILEVSVQNRESLPEEIAKRIGDHIRRTQP